VILDPALAPLESAAPAGSIRPAPRQFTPGAAGLADPAARSTRLAARRAFVELKQVFLDLAAEVEPGRADWLLQLVRHAEAPVDLWLLRAPLFDALEGPGECRRERRHRLRAGLSRVFPDTTTSSLFGPLVQG
jgi:hypothetical protein